MYRLKKPKCRQWVDNNQKKNYFHDVLNRNGEYLIQEQSFMPKHLITKNKKKTINQYLTDNIKAQPDFILINKLPINAALH